MLEDPASSSIHLDRLYALLAQGMPPGPAAIYAKAIHRPGLAALCERCDGNTEQRSTPWPTSMPSIDDFYDDIFAGKVPSVICALAAGVDANVAGPRIFKDDAGCCQWSPLAAAAEASARRGNCRIIMALLLLAKADCNRACNGPCGLTPLMLASCSGSEEACAMLVRAGADSRPRHASGRTALDMGTQATQRTIRAEREARLASSGPVSSIGKAAAPKLRAAKTAGVMKAALAHAQVSPKPKGTSKGRS